MNDHQEVEAVMTFLRTEEGGRNSPAFSGYRPPFQYQDVTLLQSTVLVAAFVRHIVLSRSAPSDRGGPKGPPKCEPLLRQLECLFPSLSAIAAQWARKAE